MRRALLTAAVIVAIPAILFADGAGAGAATTRWSCVASDTGAQNPGPQCPKARGYSYRGITNSNGFNTYVINDMWNPPGRGHPQTIYVDNPGHLEVVSDQPKSNVAVLSYPDVQQVFTRTNDSPAPLSGFRTIFSDFRESLPGGDNEAAYDIWLGTSRTSDYSKEVMIWVDSRRTSPPPGRIVGSPVFYGVKFTVWDDGNTDYMLRDRNETSGRIHILVMLQWLERHGEMSRNSGLNQVDFGWEICSTGSRPETFTMSAYTLRLGCLKGGTGCWS